MTSDTVASVLDLETLIGDIGPMPGHLAVEYGLQAARELEALHLKGAVHGDIRPKNLLVRPIVESSRKRPDGTPRMRPASNATVKVAEADTLLPTGEGEYLPPERRDEGTPTPAGDVYMLGASLYFLLTGQVPTEIAPLNVVRPDAPAQLVALIAEMMRANPAVRPSMAGVVDSLESQAKSTTSKPSAPPPAAEVIHDAIAVDVELEETGEVNLVSAEPEAVPLVATELAPVVMQPERQNFSPPALEPLATWAAPVEFVPQAYEPEPPRSDSYSERRREREAAPKRSNKKTIIIWLSVGLALNLIAVGIWAYMATRGGSSEDETPAPKIEKKNPKKKGVA